jgi:hypothetical protein
LVPCGGDPADPPALAVRDPVPVAEQRDRRHVRHVHVLHLSRVPAQTWARPSAGVGKSRRRCGRVSAQMWARLGSPRESAAAERRAREARVSASSQRVSPCRAWTADRCGELPSRLRSDAQRGAVRCRSPPSQVPRVQLVP